MSPHRPRKRFGQHFLRDPAAIDAIIRAIAPTESDTVVEIGPGDAALTRPLSRRVASLHAIELDRDLTRRLRQEFSDRPNVTIHEADALSFDYAILGESLRIVGNLPYNISTPLLFALVGFRMHIVDMHFMLQKEVVDRMAAQPGSKAYGRLSIMLGCHFGVEALFDVDRLAFDPPPEVTSSVVRLRPHAPGTFDIKNEVLLSRLVAQAFSQRRKTIRNALRKTADEAALEAAGIDPGLRPEAVPIASYVRLANTLE
jgi:16S rRNA (adenine1518-N6/adenine1519-N6)-dimethyltransferase